MLGSSRWNRAHDLERKLGPWKHARVMWLPWRLIEPPSCTASSGRGIWKREMWQPAITFSTPGQWRWWAASMSVWQWRFGNTKWEASRSRQTNQLWLEHEACCQYYQDQFLFIVLFLSLYSSWSFQTCAACACILIISWACCITFICWTTLSKSGTQIRLIWISNHFTSYKQHDCQRHLLCIASHAAVCTKYFTQQYIKGMLTKLSCSFLSADDGSFWGQVGSRPPGGKGPLAGVKLLSEKLLQLHADLDEVWCGRAWNDHLENVPLQVSVDEDLTGRRRGEKIEREEVSGRQRRETDDWDDD